MMNKTKWERETGKFRVFVGKKDNVAIFSDFEATFSDNVVTFSDFKAIFLDNVVTFPENVATSGK